MSSRANYRADIDGLRAVAVIAVILFHAFPGKMPGGFVGVDVFFVISGFLITGIIYNNLKKGSFSFYDFWARRIRRILPALLFVIIAVFIAGWFYLLPTEFETLKSHIKWGLAFAANFKLNSEVGYFDVSADLKPLLHLWSLAIEEQFYLIWPAIMFVCSRRRLNLLTSTILLASASFFCRKLFLHTGEASFYMPWTRFWELLIGAVIAIYYEDYSAQFVKYFEIYEKRIRPFFLKDADAAKGFKVVREILSCLGISLITYACFKFDKSTPFPSKMTFIPVVGASLLIIAGRDAWFNKNILSSRPMVFVGLISFPLYLWHWPLLSYLRIIQGDPSWEFKLIAVGFSFCLAVFTYYSIESVMRFELGKFHWRAPALLIVASALILVTKYSHIDPYSIKFGVEKINSAIDTWVFPTPKMTIKEFPNGLPYYEISTENSKKVLLIGNSHMCQWAPAFEKIASIDNHFPTVLFVDVSGCEGPIPRPAIQKTYDQIKDLILSGEDFESIFWASHWKGFEKEIQAGLVDGLLDAASKRNQRIFLILDYPEGPEFDPRSMIRRKLSGGFELGPSFISKNEAIQRQKKETELLVPRVQHFGAKLINPIESLCHNDKCPIRDADGYPLYKDSHHFGPYASTKHLTFIQEKILPAVNASM